VIAASTDSLPAKKKRNRPAIMRSFYGSAMDRASALALRYAEDMEGLDKEIALLRTKLREAAGSESQVRFEIMVRGVDILAKLVAVRYRLSKKAEKDMASHIAALLRGFSDQFHLEPRDGS
jgi:hypothetical protein